MRLVSKRTRLPNKADTKQLEKLVNILFDSGVRLADIEVKLYYDSSSPELKEKIDNAVKVGKLRDVLEKVGIKSNSKLTIEMLKELEESIESRANDLRKQDRLCNFQYNDLEKLESALEEILDRLEDIKKVGNRGLTRKLVQLESAIRNSTNEMIGQLMSDNDRYIEKNLILMLFDYPLLERIGVEIAAKKGFSEDKQIQLLHRLVEHRNWEKYSGLIRELVNQNPSILNTQIDLGDFVSDTSVIEDKYKLLAMLINACKGDPNILDIVDINKIFKTCQQDQELIILGVWQYGIETNAQELEAKTYNHSKKNKEGLNLLAAAIKACDNKTFIEAWQSITAYVKSGLMSQEELKNLVLGVDYGSEQKGVDKIRSLWSMSKEKKNSEAIELIYAKYSDQIEQNESFYNDSGEHKFAKDTNTAKLSKLYKLTGWNITIKEAIEGININKVNVLGNSLLHELIKLREDLYNNVKLNKLEAIKFVISQDGIDIDITGRPDKMTPLHLACRSAQKDIADLLVKKGAKSDLQDHNGISAAEYQPSWQLCKENGTSQESNNDPTVMMMTNIVYDNKLLNHYDLLEDAIKLLGLDEVLHLSKRLDSTLLSEAIENADTDLLLAGLTSVSMET